MSGRSCKAEIGVWKAMNMFRIRTTPGGKGFRKKLDRGTTAKEECAVKDRLLRGTHPPIHYGQSPDTTFEVRVTFGT